MKNYYFPISSECLAHYFGNACIMPSKYFPKKPNDIQNSYDDFLLITKHLGTAETDCCLELVFTKNELNDLIEIGEGFYLYQKPLPISRVKRVLFSDKNQMEHTIVNITMSTAFVPKEIIKKVDSFDSVIHVKSKTDFKKRNWSAEIKKFNSFLGGFALMRLSGEDYMNYSENYFSTLSFFNEIIKNELEIAGIKIYNGFFDAFIGENSFKVLHSIINQNIDENVLNHIAREEGQKIVKENITRVVNLDKLEKATYVVAVLNTFGVGDEARKKKIDGLILSNFKSDVKSNKSEVIALCYGLNRGYSAFSNKYKSKDIEKNVKFKLDSQVDYYTIESLFQFVFNKTKSAEFPYLDNWCAKNNPSSQRNKTDYNILDVLVIGKKKPKVGSFEYMENLFKNFYTKITEKIFDGKLKDVVSQIIEEVSEDKDDEMEMKFVEERERINKSIQLQLHKVDAFLFDEIDENNDGVLDSDEIASFLNKLKQSKKDVEDLSQSHQEKTGVIDNSICNTKQTVPVISVSEKEKIAKEVLEYIDLPVITLRKKASERGIDDKKIKKNDLIIKLIITKENSLF